MEEKTTPMPMTSIRIQRYLHNIDEGVDDSPSVTDCAVKVAVFSFWAMFVGFNVYLIWVTSKSQQRRLQRLREEAQNQTTVHAIATKLAGMTTDAKIAYFSMLFVKQGNELTLTKDQIFVVEESMKGTKNGDATEDDIETGTNIAVISRKNDTIDTEEQLPLVQLSPTTVHACEEPATCGSSNDSETSRTTMKHKIDGQCAICLEMYNIGDTIAYNMNTCRNSSKSKNSSESRQGGNGCYHVYHKTCLVQYLSNRKISEKGLSDGHADIPLCLTCRAPYVELLPIDANYKLECTTGEEASETHTDDSPSLSMVDIDPHHQQANVHR